MNAFEAAAVVFAIGFLIWKTWSWASWEIEKKIFFRSVRHFLEKAEEDKLTNERKGK